MKPVSVAIVGAGDRGRTYADYCLAHPEEGKVVAVAEPIEARRERMAAEHKIDPRYVFSSWRELIKKPRLAEAAVIGTQDRDHKKPAIALARRGYHILLEKPMAPTAADCKAIVEAIKAAGVVFAVGHVMRYSPYFKRLKDFIDSGAIGEIVAIEHLEPVGYWHIAHSFVRGHWRNTEESSFMLLAKSCHDIDILRYLVGKPCVAVSSFGSLMHFRKERKPEGAGMRCVSCAIEPKCPYSAKKIYFTGKTDWPVCAITDDLTPEGIRKAVETGPYGRCVYECDNDVVDHQVVNLLYEGGATASFTMCGFTEMIGRQSRIMGTLGEIVGDRSGFRHYDFLTDKTTQYSPTTDAGYTGHGGGDEGLMREFLAACTAKDPSMIKSGPDVTLETHLTVFAAEKARLKGTVEKIKLSL